MIKVCLKGDVVKEFPKGITAYDVAKEISMGLAKQACAVRVNGENKDLNHFVKQLGQHMMKQKQLTVKKKYLYK